MKILNVISHFSSGGAEIFCKDLSIALKKNHEVIILALANSNDLEFESKYVKELELHNIKYKILNKRKGRDRIKNLIQIRKFISEINPDIINTHLEYVTFHVCNAAMGMNIPIVQTIHSTVINYKKIQKYYLNNHCERYIAISDTVKNSIQEKISLNDAKIKTIYNGVNLSKFQYQTRQINDEVNRIVLVGRLSEEKNHELFIRAYKEVTKLLKQYNLPIPTVDIIGTGSLKDKLLNLISELGLKEYINLLGSKDNINELLFNYDIYVLPSKWEGFSISLLEALSTRIPVIATNVGSNSEMIDSGKTGFIIDNENQDELVKTLMLLINSSKLRKLIYNNTKNITKNYDISKTAEEYVELFKELI